MRITFIKKEITSKKTNEKFYGLCLALVDEKGKIIREDRRILMWLNEEEYNSLSIN